WVEWSLDELDDVRLTPRRFAPRTLPPGRADHLRAHVRSRWHHGVLTVYTDVATLEDSLHHHVAEIEEITPDGCRVRIQCPSWDSMSMRLALHGIDFRVDDPHELAEACQRIAGRLWRASGEIPRTSGWGSIGCSSGGGSAAGPGSERL